MLALQKTDNSLEISISPHEQAIGELLTREWLLTNGRGGYASSTIVCCNTRRYHGLLIGTLRPPVSRVMALSNCQEMIISDGEVFNLSSFEFEGKIASEGFGFLKRFRRDVGIHYDYEVRPIKMTKSIYLLRDRDMVGLVYDFSDLRNPVDFVTRPFVGLRDFHALQKPYASLCSREHDNNVLVRYENPDSCELLMSCHTAVFEKDPQWWFNFVYRVDRERGQDFSEDLWTPGFFKCHIDEPSRVVLWASLRTAASGRKLEFTHDGNDDINAVVEDLYEHSEMLRHRAKSVKSFPGLSPMHLDTLYVAADNFITRRQAKNKHRSTILAGYPWFADWGRDAFISLPGLLLMTGRFDEARSVLTTFAAATDDGMIPNRFDDFSGTTFFNSVDASLWFINAAFQYLRASGDSKTFMLELMPVIRWIMDSYQKGTRFDIHADTDGLISAGNCDTQLTWMDAKCDGIAFTPRYGKAVEVNALWYNGLCLLARFYAERDIELSKNFDSIAQKVKASFCDSFWNEDKGYLNDCILPDGKVDDSLRPNQIFAVSLPFSPLLPARQISVVAAVRENLLTPYGLRTLNSSSAGYKGKYTGPQRQRDEAYHQGTVWPYLIGPFVESFLKVNEFSKKSKKQAAEFISPLLRHLTEDGCIGSISEIFDGDFPHKPRGCFAQAWSVAELLRACLLINS